LGLALSFCLVWIRSDFIGGIGDKSGFGQLPLGAKKFDGVGLIADPDFTRRRENKQFFFSSSSRRLLLGELTSTQTSGAGAMGVVPLISWASKMPLP
jgi:hypothetical protein